MEKKEKKRAKRSEKKPANMRSENLQTVEFSDVSL